MDLLEQLTRTNADPALIAQLRAALTQQAQQIAEKDVELHTMRAQNNELLADGKSKDFKIKALTLELAHHKRIRFGKASEAYSGEQLDLFNEAVDADLAAMQAELDALQGRRRAPRSRAGRQPLPPELPRIEHRHEPASCQCDACGRSL